MKIDEKTVREIAHLARLEFDDTSTENAIQDLNRMLEFVNRLNELDTSGIEPLIHMTEEFNVLRNDESVVSISQQEALLNAPKKDSDYFKVAKVIEQK